MTVRSVCILFCLAHFAAAGALCRGVKLRTRDLCMCALIIALTMVLESICIPLPTGAAMPVASMAPLMLLAVLFDARLSFLSGWICGALSILLLPGWAPVHWGQFFVEHMVCFSCMGYTGVFGADRRWKIFCGVLLVSGVKLSAHVLSGVLFFSQNAWSGWGAWGYSILYNLSQNLPLCVLSGGILLTMPLDMLRQTVGKPDGIRGGEMHENN